MRSGVSRYKSPTVLDTSPFTNWFIFSILDYYQGPNEIFLTLSRTPCACCSLTEHWKAGKRRLLGWNKTRSVGSFFYLANHLRIDTSIPETNLFTVPGQCYFCRPFFSKCYCRADTVNINNLLQYVNLLTVAGALVLHSNPLKTLFGTPGKCLHSPSAFPSTRPIFTFSKQK